MKIILAAAITILALVALSIKKFKNYRWIIMAAYMAGVIILFAFYNYKTIDLILPFYHPDNQMFYQKEFAEDGEYPDAILPYVLNGKNVYLPSYIYWMEETIDSEESWKNGQMLSMNIENVLTNCGASVIYSAETIKINEEQAKSFEEFGYLNDTFRYSFLYNNLTGEYGNGFYYYWFYNANAAPIRLYVCTQQLEESEDLYLLFDSSLGCYLISKDYFEKEVAGL